LIDIYNNVVHTGSTEFWKTIKPFISGRSHANDNVTLMENFNDFNVHVSEICRKAGYKLNVLSRLSRHLDVKAKLLLLHSFILSFFNYCAVA
jgi:hypothetical protein